ncbi:MAG: fumarate reductase subunit FrdD [Gammaproteobacteria bacterium]|nr:fumarate reductase subunit FrdD [Gammaproteobacteria bacterium]MDJ0891145.1 fumarate reductase subunit FrdD [Gammaproteobacteria bacterium]
MRRSNEPIFWSLFGAGGVIASLILPVLILITGIAVPLGIMPAETLSYERMSGFLDGWFGKLFVFAVISLTFWHAFHRIYHSLHDFGIHAGLGVFRVLAYGIALVGTLGAGYYVLAI